MIYDILESPIGLLTIGSDGTNVTDLHIEGDRYFTGVPQGWKRDPDNKILQATRAQLAEYFAGTRQSFNIPVAPQGTVFQQTVWRALGDIPRGSTETYGSIAEKIGRPGAARAVGAAVGHNPVCIILPCHRVLASDGSLGGFVAGPARKQKLLELESLMPRLTN